MKCKCVGQKWTEAVTLIKFLFSICVPPSLSDLVTDMDFSPFDECLLATCSGDETVSFPSFYFILIVLLGVYLHTNQLSILSGCVVPGTAVNVIWTWLVLLFKPFEDSLRSAHYTQPQVSKLSGICWVWVCIFRLSSSVYLRDLSKHTQLLLHTDLQHIHTHTRVVCSAL